jgi:hypothetical protein
MLGFIIVVVFIYLMVTDSGGASCGGEDRPGRPHGFH